MVGERLIILGYSRDQRNLIQTSAHTPMLDNERVLFKKPHNFESLNAGILYKGMSYSNSEQVVDEIYIFGGKYVHGRQERSVMAWNISTGLSRSLVGIIFDSDAFGTALLSGQMPNSKDELFFGMAVCGGVSNCQAVVSAAILYPERKQ